MAEVLQLYNVFGAATERTMFEVPSALAQRGHRMTWAAESVDTDPESIGVVHDLPRIAVRPGDDAAVEAELQAVARREPAVPGRFDLVHGHFGPRLLHALPHLARGTPAVVSCYGYDTSRLLRDPAWATRYRVFAERGGRFVALSDDMRRRLTACGVPASSVDVIPLGIDPDAWTFDPAETRERRLLFVGRFVEKKGLDTLLHAWAELCRDPAFDDAGLDVVGGGDAGPATLAERLAIAQRVRFRGVMPYEELGDVMRSAWALVAPSCTAADGDAEGCPMVLMQAQAVGTPVVTTAHAGNPEALPPEAQGFVVPERDAGALAEAMRKILSLDVASLHTLRAAGRAWIERRFDLRRTTDAYDRLYRKRSG
ncbi:MAG: glycosyltransferase family 4 protein [Planctomycetota bacterium]